MLAVLKLSIMAAAFLLRHELLAFDFGSHLLPALLALPVFALAISVQRRRREKLAPKALNGLPELTATSQDPGHLIEDGIYAHLRHPRYLELSLILLGWALLSNYLAIYVIAAGAPFILTWTALLEERELRQRFGATYDAYCRRVPRILPKFVTHRFSPGRC